MWDKMVPFIVCFVFTKLVPPQVYLCQVLVPNRLLTSPMVHYRVYLFQHKSNQIKSNQILLKIGNIHLKEKKISKKIFTELYSITFNNKLYILFKYFGTSL